MEVSDWRCVSQHYILDLIEKAVDKQQLRTRFDPTLLISAGEDSVSISRTLRAVLRQSNPNSRPVTVLTHHYEIYDEEANPYNPLTCIWGDKSFGGHRILVVDKVDNTRISLSNFIADLQQRINAQRATYIQDLWREPQVGVFVLHNKRRPKAADLPEAVLDGRYFACDECDNVSVSYPFNHDDMAPHQQPKVSGDHPHQWGAPGRGITAEVHRVASPPLPGDTRVLSSHYIDEIIEKTLTEQRLYERFAPTLIVSASDHCNAAARLLKHHLRLRSGVDIPMLTSKLDLYDDSNPYNPIAGSWMEKSLSGQHILVVEQVDNSRLSLATFFAQLQQHLDGQRFTSIASSAAWAEPVLGVFVLHHKDRPKLADLPQEVLSADHYFVAENTMDVNIAYPFEVNCPPLLAALP